LIHLRDLDDFLTRARPHRQAFVLLFDSLLVALSWHVTYLFRVGFDRWHLERPSYDVWVLSGLMTIYLMASLAFGVPKGMWRFSGFGEVKRLTLACFTAGLVGAVIVLMSGLYGVPRAVLGLHPFFALMSMVTVRIFYRMFYEHLRAHLTGTAQETRRALIIGAGDAARLLITGLQHQGWAAVGCLDDDPARCGVRLGNVTVLGNIDSVEHWAKAQKATHIIVAMPSATLLQRRHALDLASRTRLPVLTVPSASELQEGRASISHVRDIQAEDLLGREAVQLDERGLSEMLSGNVVLITGAGGSIGSELCRQVARYGPEKIVLYELNEFNLYTIEQELSERFPRLPLVRLMGDVKNLDHVRRVFQRYRPKVVFHAAAYKHVPLMEHDNAWAALCNNTLGTYHAAVAAQESGVERFVLISTDKAVNPTNVMGATKRAAEMVMSHMAHRTGHAIPEVKTRFMAVRFGNVLGSSGSVIPKFKAQIAKGGPVTVTHPDITRYFMTISEAARLVIQAGAIGEGGQVFVLDMGDPVKIAQLAKDLIRISGHSPEDIPIVYTGLRPGEKLFEELLADADATLPTAFAALRIAKLERADDAVKALVDWIASGIADSSDRVVRERLAALVREYPFQSA
jgi:FlaA1/EpsC-like NDP-sugar epimerase